MENTFPTSANSNTQTTPNGDVTINPVVQANSVLPNVTPTAASINQMPVTSVPSVVNLVDDAVLAVKTDEKEDLDLAWVRWKCLNCGFNYEGRAIAFKCPKCGNEDPDKFEDAD